MDPALKKDNIVVLWKLSDHQDNIVVIWIVESLSW